MDRTDEQKVMRAPVEITIGGRVIQMQPLGWRRASAWLRSVSGVLDKGQRLTAGGDGSAQIEIAADAIDAMGQAVIDYGNGALTDDDVAAIESASVEEIAGAFNTLLPTAVVFTKPSPSVNGAQP